VWRGHESVRETLLAGEAMRLGKRIPLESSAGTLVEIVGVAQTIKYQGSIENHGFSCICRWPSILSANGLDVAFERRSAGN